MATHLQEQLQSLFWKSEWNYAVFWKLDLHAPMIVGEVAVAGKLQWIFSSDYIVDFYLSQKIGDECQEQFSAGVKTLVVGAVPHEVVQLGSLNERGKFKPVNLVDVPRHSRLRPKLDEYLPQAAGLVFVVDVVEFLPNVRAAAEYMYDILAKGQCQ